MGRTAPITILKMGGSLLTNKDRPLSINRRSLNAVANAIKRSGLPLKGRQLFLVHGGGSYGHYYANKFGLSTVPKQVSPLSVSKTAASMIELHSEVLKALVRSGIACESVLAQDLIKPDFTLSRSGIRKIECLLSLNIIPVTFGNVAHIGRSTFILSGDSICASVASSMPVNRVIFGMDVDGIYRSEKLGGGILKQISARNEIRTRGRLYDVTGGIASKIRVGLNLAEWGIEIFFVNGNKPKRLTRLLSSDSVSDVPATVIRPAKKRTFGASLAV